MGHLRVNYTNMLYVADAAYKLLAMCHHPRPHEYLGNPKDLVDDVFHLSKIPPLKNSKVRGSWGNRTDLVIR